MLAQLRYHRQGGGHEPENRPEARVVTGGQGPIQVEDTTIRQRDGRSYNGSLLYTVKPIEQILKEREKEFLAELKLEEARRFSAPEHPLLPAVRAVSRDGRWRFLGRLKTLITLF